MSIEVQVQPQTAQETSSTERVAPRTTVRSAPWGQRRYAVGAGFVIALIAAAFVGNSILSRQYSPEGAVTQYLSALQSGQVDSAWSAVQVPASDSAGTSVTDKAAFKAALAANHVDLKSFVITGTTNLDSNTAAIGFNYDTSQGSKQGTVVVKRSGQNHLAIYRSWAVQVTPAVLQLTQPTGGGPVLIDGREIAVGAGTQNISVLPLAHTVQFAGSSMLAPQTVKLDMFDGVKHAVAYTAKLTPAGQAQATAALKSLFENCAKQSSPRPEGCPQHYDGQFVDSGQWQQLTDPVQGMAISTDANGNLVAGGHFLMKFGYHLAGTDGTLWSVSGGGYQAELLPGTDDVVVGALGPAKGISGLDRPAAASDQAAKDVVASALAACASVRSGSPADCPQGYPWPDAKDFSWHVNGDPMNGATVSFDQNSGVITVHGNFSMTATYSVYGYQYSHDSYTNKYDAYLYWNGQKLVLVTISGN